MTREEKAIIYFKDMRKRLCEDYLNICPKDSVAYKATLAEKDFYDVAIKALEQTRWIPVSERLPEKTGIYLISIGDLVTSKSFDGHNFRTESEVRFIPDAWMPLPTPYKAESEVQE